VTAVDQPTEVLDETEGDDDLARPSVRLGAGQLAASKGFQLVFRMATSLVLARLLEPSDFGLLGLVGVLMVFLQRTIAESGTTNALVQRERVSDRLASSVFWFNLAVGAGIAWIFFVCAPLLASVLGEEAARDILRGMSLTFIFSAVVKVPQAMLRRQMRFGAIAGLGLINALVTGLVAIPLALAGHGVASMVIGQVVATVVEAILTFIVARWRPVPVFKRSELRSVTGYARSMTGFNFVSYFSDAGDKYIVGRFVGTTALGIYNLPYRLLFQPVAALGQVVREILFPLFSRRQHDSDRIAHDFLRTVGALALVTFPLCAVVAALGSPIVDVVLGPKWQEAGPILTVMAIVALEQSIISTGGVILTARGRTNVLLRWGIVSGVVNLAAYVIGVQWGVMGVSVGFLVATTVLAYPAMAIPFREIGLPVRRLVDALSPAAVATVLMTIVALGARIGTEQAHVSRVGVLAAGGSSAVVALAAALAWQRPPAFVELLATARRRLGR
jgi:O-antigen/teichoic acid export membrane protein